MIRSVVSAVFTAVGAYYRTIVGFEILVNDAFIACPSRRHHSRLLLRSIHSPTLLDPGLCVVARAMLRFSCQLLAHALHSLTPPHTYLKPSMTPVMNALPSPTSIPPTPFILNPPPASTTSTPLLNLAILTSLSPLNNCLTLSGSSKSSLAASNNISPSSNQ